MQVRQNVKPLVYQAKVLNAEIEKLIAEFESVFKCKDPKQFSRAQKNEFSDKVLSFEDALDVYKKLAVDLKSAFKGELTEEDKELWQDLRETSENANELAADLRSMYEKFSSEIIAASQNVFDFLLPEKVVRGFNRWFSSTSTLQLKSTEL